MKRPEGFAGEKAEAPRAATRPVAATSTSATGHLAHSSRPARPSRRARRVAARSTAAATRPATLAMKTAPVTEARTATRARRRDERAEVRRFTRRSRRRRLIAAGIGITVLSLIGGAALVAVSPLMSLATVDVLGASRLDSEQVGAVLIEYIGTPLALLDDGSIRDDLAAFPLIRSFSTEIVPPDTLVVRIIERVPVAAVERGTLIDLVDAAGVVVETSEQRPAGIPLIAAESSDSSSLAFRSIAAVLLDLPDELRMRVDVIRATTRDDVTFTMTGVAHRVVWGSSERSVFKARVLEAAVAATGQSETWEYDVSAPENLVVRRL